MDQFLEAVLQGDVRKLRQVLDSGLDPNALLDMGRPLHFCCCVWAPENTEQERIALCDELLRRGADINGLSVMGATPLDDALSAGKRQLAEFLKGRGGQAASNPMGLSDAQANQMAAELGLGIPGRQPTGSAEERGSWATPVLSLVIAVGLVGALWFGLQHSGLLGELQPSPSPTTPAQPPVAMSETFLKQAEEAMAAESFTEASTRAEQALAALKSEGASKQDVLRVKELLARACYKAKQYRPACAHYSYLAKARPEDKQLKQTVQLVKREFWQKELKPKLDEAKRHLANGRRDEARQLVNEVREAAHENGLNAPGASELAGQLDSAEASALASMSAARKEAYLNQIITVRVTSWANPMGTPTKMTRREYIRRKNSPEYR